MGLASRFLYEFATLTAGTLAATGQCYGIRIFANGVDGSFKMSGDNLPIGDTVTIRSNTGVDINFPDDVSIVNPVVTWVSGSLDVLIGVKI